MSENLHNRKSSAAVSPGPAETANSDSYQQLLQKRGAGESKCSKLKTRLLYGWILIFLFLGLMYSGPIYVCLLVAFLQVLIYRELLNIRYNAAKAEKVPLFRTIQWLWFAVAMMYIYGDSFFDFLATLDSHSYDGKKLKNYHTALSYLAYCALFVASTISLKEGSYKYQMKQLTWTAITVMLIVFQMKSAISNILSGLFWFLLPCSLIICNDCMAYFFGLKFGRRFFGDFLKLSPNKTWEGFIGGGVSTLVFSYYYAYLLAQVPWLICPPHANLSPAFSCDPHPVFLPVTYEVIPQFVPLMGPTFMLLPCQIHSVILAIFASAIAPFGGFFASGMKRAFKIKDFDSLIPGHGGMMDRMDCQFLMASYTRVHFMTFVQISSVSAAFIWANLKTLSRPQQEQILAQLTELLA